MSSRCYQNYVRVGFKESNDGVTISIPDALHFPHTYIFAAVDAVKRRVFVSPDPIPGHPEAPKQMLGRVDSMPGARYFTIEGVRGIGKHFAITPTFFSQYHAGIQVEIPADGQRPAPNSRGVVPQGLTKVVAIRTSPVAQVAKTIAEGEEYRRNRITFPVLIDVNKDTLVFNVPAEEMIALIVKWTRNKYNND